MSNVPGLVDIWKEPFVLFFYLKYTTSNAYVFYTLFSPVFFNCLLLFFGIRSWNCLRNFQLQMPKNIYIYEKISPILNYCITEHLPKKYYTKFRDTSFIDLRHAWNRIYSFPAAHWLKFIPYIYCFVCHSFRWGFTLLCAEGWRPEVSYTTRTGLQCVEGHMLIPDRQHENWQSKYRSCSFLIDNMQTDKSEYNYIYLTEGHLLIPNRVSVETDTCWFRKHNMKNYWVCIIIIIYMYTPLTDI